MFQLEETKINITDHQPNMYSIAFEITFAFFLGKFGSCILEPD